MLIIPFNVSIDFDLASFTQPNVYNRIHPHMKNERKNSEVAKLDNLWGICSEPKVWKRIIFSRDLVVLLHHTHHLGQALRYVMHRLVPFQCAYHLV